LNPAPQSALHRPAARLNCRASRRAKRSIWKEVVAAVQDEKLSSLSIIVPAYNEEESLADVVDSCVDVGKRIAHKLEVLIVNDGSADSTGDVAEEMHRKHDCVRVITHPFNMGFGAAQKTGFVNSRHDYVTLVPADKQFDPNDLCKYLPLIKSSDVVVGYRVNRADPIHRRINTRVFRMVMKLLFGVNLRDINWVKLFRRHAIEGMDIFSDGIGIDAEVVVKARSRGCRFSEVEVGYLPRTTGVSTGDSPVNVCKTVIDLLILWCKINFTDRRRYRIRR